VLGSQIDKGTLPLAPLGFAFAAMR
jgi:hypothetical protein